MSSGIRPTFVSLFRMPEPAPLRPMSWSPRSRDAPGAVMSRDDRPVMRGGRRCITLVIQYGSLDSSSDESLTRRHVLQPQRRRRRCCGVRWWSLDLAAEANHDALSLKLVEGIAEVAAVAQ